jgi:hypothetical protein
VGRRTDKTDFGRSFAKEFRKLRLFRCVAPVRKKEKKGKEN